MSTRSSLSLEPGDSSASLDRERERDRSVENSRSNSFGRHLESEPTPRSWMVVAAGGIVPLGLSIAAAITTNNSTSDRVSLAAWIAVAVVGTASVISSAVASRYRSVDVGRDKQGLRTVDQSHSTARHQES